MTEKKGLRIVQYAILMRLNKPIGIFLLMWPTLWALWIAGKGSPDPVIVIVFILGVVLMRSAGCVINDFADRHIDQRVERTKNRPIVAGRVTPKEALVLFMVLCIAAFGLVLLLNTLTIILSLVAVVLAVIYPFMKRHTHIPQAFLGLAFGWAVPMAFAAQTEAIPKEAWLLLMATALWATAYDTMYAMVDRPDDVKIGVKSTAILFGGMDRAVIAALQIGMLSVMLIIGHQMKFNVFYYGGLIIATGFGFYQQALLKLRKEQLYFRAFKNNALLGAAVFAGIVLHYIYE